MRKDSKEIERRKHIARIGAIKVALSSYRTDIDERKISDIEKLFNLLIELRKR